MSSKGNPIVKFRLDHGLLADIEIAIQGRNLFSPEEAWTISDFLRIAAREKIQKMCRSRRHRGRRRPATSPRTHEDSQVWIAAPTNEKGRDEDA